MVLRIQMRVRVRRRVCNFACAPSYEEVCDCKDAAEDDEEEPAPSILTAAGPRALLYWRRDKCLTAGLAALYGRWWWSFVKNELAGVML